MDLESNAAHELITLVTMTTPYLGKKIETINYKEYTINKIISEGNSENSIPININKNLKFKP